MIFQGQWSTLRNNHRAQNGREPAAKPINSCAEDSSDLLRLLPPNQLLPVRRHLQRQLEKEREQADGSTQSGPDPRLSIQCEWKFRQGVSVSVDGTQKSEGQ